MRILFVNQKCGRFGGVEGSVGAAAAGLAGRGHRCFLAYGESTGRGAAEHAALFEHTFLCRELAPSASAPTFAELRRRLDPDVIYVHKVPPTAPEPWLAPGRGRVRAVRMVHDHDLCCPRRHKYYALSEHICRHRAGWRCWLDGAFLERDAGSPAGLRRVSIGRRLEAMRRSHGYDAVLVGSRFMRDELLQNGFPPERVWILPPVAADARRAPTPVSCRPHVLYVGQLIRGKGVDLLLRALAQVRQPFLARVAGDGNAAGDLRGLAARLGLKERVRFEGFCESAALDELYRWSRVVAVPSRWPEPFGLIGLEAMAHGRPVVAFDAGGIRDWLEHGRTGLLVPAGETQALARALERLLADDELAARLGHGGWELSRARFGFGAYLDQLEGHLGGGAAAAGTRAPQAAAAREVVTA